MTELLKFKGVSKKYGKLLALDSATFTLNEGEVFGYIGTNGAGKTTTIKILVGLLRQNSGEYFLSDKKIPEELSSVKKLFGYLPQNVAFQEWRTVDQALRTFGLLSGINASDLDSRIRETLDLLEIGKTRNIKIKRLSGGTIQKVGIAQAILHKPKFLVMDEPLSGLDPASRNLVKEIIMKLKNEGTTVFFSSHILSDVEDVANRVGIINKGRIIKIGTIDELREHFSKTEDIEISFSRMGDALNILGRIKEISLIENNNNGTVSLQIPKTVDLDYILHESIKELIDNGCRLRYFKPVTPALDELYLKYIREDDGL
jgi:ABC-2 type transport system ATP-binding protein